MHRVRPRNVLSTTGGWNARTVRAGIDRFPRCRILVVGDVMVDEYVWGRVSRISPEAPVPVVEVVRESLMLGGAGNVAHNIHSLGGRTILCGVIGDDRMGRELVDMVRGLGLSTHGLVVEAGRPTTIKTRVVARPQQVVRVDREVRRAVEPETAEKLLAIVAAELPHLDAIVVSDYSKGVVTQALMDGIRTLSRKTKIRVAVDPKVKSPALYRQATLITPNQRDAEMMSGVAIEDEASLERAGRRLLEELDCQIVLVTRGEAGMALFQRDGRGTHIPTVARTVFDVSGAGDTVISTFTLGMAAGLTPYQAAVVANVAAGIVVGEVGTATVPAERLKEAISDGVKRRGRSRA